MTRLNDGWAGLSTLVTTIPELDPAAANAGALVRYVGPIFERHTDMDWDSPWDASDDRPLVLVSFTTTGLWDQRGRIRNTLDALRDEPVRVLVTAADPGDIGVIPTNVAIRPFVPHAAVLPSSRRHGDARGSWDGERVPRPWGPYRRSSQCVGGSAVSGGDTPAAGAGLALDGEAEPDAIRSAIWAVMTQPSYVAAAKTLAAAIRATPGVKGAATKLERLALAARF